MYNYVPSGYKTINLFLVVRGVQKALDFYNRAFGAEIVMELKDPNGAIVHAEMKIADTIVMIAEEDPKLPGGNSAIVQLYTPDAEGFFEDAVKAGAKVVYPIKKEFFGDRCGRLADPFGHHWIISTHEEDVPFREMERRFHELHK